MKRITLLLVSIAASLPTLLLTGCGEAPDPGSLVDSGVRELRSGDPGAAAALLDEALSKLDAEHPDYARAQAALAEALAPFQPDEARDRFLAFSERCPQLVDARLYRSVSSSMFKAGAQEQAIDVLSAGISSFPDQPELVAAKAELDQRLAQGKTPAEIDRLRSLGYLGTD